jgi:glutamate racemase
MSTQPIIVFDSGIGGMSIYRPLKKALPNENLVYIADSANFPYGDKSQAWLTERFTQLGQDFKLLNPKLLVLACNTATTGIIADLRASLNCPIVGVEPVIKPLAAYARALALMTHATATSEVTKKLLKDFGPHVEIYTPTGLATAIEFNDFEQVKNNIHAIKEIVQKNNIQAIGLSCTHYPLIMHELRAAMPEVIFIDPSDAVVAQAIRVLGL